MKAAALTFLLAASQALGAAGDPSPVELLARAVPKASNIEIRLLRALDLGDRKLEGTITRLQARQELLTGSCKDIKFRATPAVSKAKDGSAKARKEIAANLRTGGCWTLAQLRRATAPTHAFFSAELTELRDPVNLPDFVLPVRQYRDRVRAEVKDGGILLTSFSLTDPKRKGSTALLQPIARVGLSGDHAEELILLRTARGPGQSYTTCEIDILRRLNGKSSRMDLTLRRRLGRCG